MSKFVSNNGKYMSGGNKKNDGGKKPGKKKKVLLTVIIILVLILALIIGGIAIFWNSMLNMLGDSKETTPNTLSSEEQEELLAMLGTTAPPETVDATDETVETSPEDTWPVIVSNENVTNIMLIGQNYREDEAHKLSDTMILCSINRETKTLTMVSFLRDMYVQFPPYRSLGWGGNRINVPYNLGWKQFGTTEDGMKYLASVIEFNFGIPIDHTIEVNFDAFVQIIDALGGVEIELTEAEADHMTNDLFDVGTFEPGLQTLDGNAALTYARIRKIDSDVARTGRQRNVISSLINSVKDAGLMDLYKMATSVLPMIVTDMSNTEITNYIFEFLPMLKDLNMVSLTCPVDNDILPGSSWPETIDLGGYSASVIKCNTWSNMKYLTEALGLVEEEE